MKHNFFTLFLVLAASIGITNAAIVNGTCGDNLTWSLNTKDSTLTIEGTGSMGNWENNVANLPPWYEYRSYIAHVVLPAGLPNIGSYAFWVCEKLRTIEIPNTVTSIGYHSFDRCVALKSINIPNGVESLAGNAFTNCSALTSIELPNSVKSIGSNAFYQCTDLTSVILPNGIRSIYYETFCGCKSLVSIEIPNSVTSIGMNAFANCRNLQSVSIGSGITELGDDAFGGLYGCPITSLTIHATNPPTGGVNCGLNAGNCTLYVPEASVEVYANTLWWEDFMNILPIPVIEPEPIDCGIIYIDKDANEIDNEAVKLHLPETPVIPGFTFDKWIVVAGDLSEGIYVQAVYVYNGDATSAPAEVVNPRNAAQKLIREGNVYILHEGKSYSVQGMEVK